MKFAKFALIAAALVPSASSAPDVTAPIADCCDGRYNACGSVTFSAPEGYYISGQNDFSVSGCHAAGEIASLGISLSTDCSSGTPATQKLGQDVSVITFTGGGECGQSSIGSDAAGGNVILASWKFIVQGYCLLGSGQHAPSAGVVFQESRERCEAYASTRPAADVFTWDSLTWKCNTYDFGGEPVQLSLCDNNANGQTFKKVLSTDTEAPTEVPTSAPTASPTAFPTSSPTGTATTAPTEAPTSAPTASPTAFPTSSPTGTLTTSTMGGLLDEWELALVGTSLYKCTGNHCFVNVIGRRNRFTIVDRPEGVSWGAADGFSKSVGGEKFTATSEEIVYTGTGKIFSFPFECRCSE